jgi:hypothetical protein
MRRLRPLLVSLLMLLVLAGAVSAQEVPRTPSAEGAEVYIINPGDGDTVASPVLIQFGLRGMGVAPAGVDLPDTGHHHLLVDLDIAEVDLALPMPPSDNLLHFGGGQTETMLELEPGTHTLQLVLGDLSHIPHDPPVISEAITVTVE